VKEGRLKSGQNLEACACLKGDTLLVGDNKPISEYVVGDKVVGMHELNRVGETFEREYDGDMIRVKAKGVLPITLTPDHPLLVITADNRPNRRSPNIRPEWKHAGDLRERHNRPSYSKGDYLLLPRVSGTYDIKELDLSNVASSRGLRHNIRSFPLNSKTAWLLGIYVAEGHSTGRQIFFALHSNETRLALSIKRILGSLGVPSTTRNQKGEQEIFVDCSSTILARALRSWCGHLAPNKTIPDFVLFHQDLSILDAFLDGYSQGDGGWARNNSRGPEPNQLQLSTTSRLLALQLQLAYARLGRYTGVYNNQHEREMTIQGRRVHAKEAYTVRYTPSNTNIRVYKKENHLFFMLPIRSISREHYKGPVYNLGAPADNTYLVANVITHNCSHSEENAIVQAAKNGIPTLGATLYSTHSPCTYCSKMIINAGIKKVVSSTPYPDQLGVRLMKEAGLQLVMI
jgi:intein/homing endonuclease